MPDRFVDRFVRRIAITWGDGTGLYDDEVCSVGPCELPPGHDGPHSVGGSRRAHPVTGNAGEIDWPASLAAYQAAHLNGPTVEIEYDDDQLSVVDKINDALATCGLILVDEGRSHDGFIVLTLKAKV